MCPCVENVLRLLHVLATDVTLADNVSFMLATRDEVGVMAERNWRLTVEAIACRGFRLWRPGWR